MAPFPSFMRERNNIWHYRRRVPADLRRIFNELHEFTKTCRSTKKGDARIMRAQYDKELDLIFLALRAKLMTPEIARHRVDELFDARKFTDSPSPPKFTSSENIVHGRKCAEVVALCMRKNSPNWSAKTLAEKEGVYNQISKRFINRLMVELTVDDVLEWRTELMEKFSVVTVNKYLSNLSGIFKFGIQHGYAIINPVNGLFLKDTRVESEIRKAYSEVDIIKIFRSLLAIKEKCFKQGRYERFWAPLVCMYTGLRVEECAQLDIADIDVNECSLKVTPVGVGDKKVKNKSSIREVPIHQDLLTLGFFVYVKNMEVKGSTKLFPKLNRHKHNGYSHELIKWWSRWGRALIPDQQKTYHSFRHSVADRLKQAGTDGFLMSEILGHKVENISVGRYGKHYDLETKRQAMQCLATGLVPQVAALELFNGVGDEPTTEAKVTLNGGASYKIPACERLMISKSPYMNYHESYCRPDWYGYDILHRCLLNDLWQEEILFELKQDILAKMG